MAPINLPDGTEVSEVILPDGASASEVVAPDGSTVFSAIPDAGLLHNYDWSNPSTTTTTVPDLKGSADLTGSFTDLTATIGGKQAGTFDGSSDTLDATFPDVPEPFAIFFVGRFRDTSNKYVAFAPGDGTGAPQLLLNNGSWAIFQGTTKSGGSPDTNAHLFTTDWGATTDILEVDGSEIINADAGSTALPGLIFGAQSGPIDFAPIDAGQLMVYDADASGYSQSDVELYLRNKWSV